MVPPPPAEPPPRVSGKRARSLRELDIVGNRTDRAIYLHIKYGVPVAEAITLTDTQGNRAAIYARVQRWRSSESSAPGSSQPPAKGTRDSVVGPIVAKATKRSGQEDLPSAPLTKRSKTLEQEPTAVDRATPRSQDIPSDDPSQHAAANGSGGDPSIVGEADNVSGRSARPAAAPSSCKKQVRIQPPRSSIPPTLEQVAATARGEGGARGIGRGRAKGDNPNGDGNGDKKHGSVFDLKVRMVSNSDPPSDEEEQLKALVKTRRPGKSGANFKLGIMFANAPTLTKACRMIKGQDEAAAKRTEQNKEMKKDRDDYKARVPFRAWRKAGGEKDEDGGPKEMAAGDVVLVAKAIVRRVDPEKPMKDIGTGVKARGWFKELRLKGTSWDGEMQKIEDDFAKNCAELKAKSKRMF